MQQRLQPRCLVILITIVLVAICLGGLVLASISSMQPLVFVLLQRGSTQVRLEVDRSPDCPSGTLGLCDIGGTGPTYFSAWLYTRPTPNSLIAQRLFAIPIAP